jgi:hypothetical protein
VRRTPVQVGFSDGKHTEVFRKQKPGGKAGEWVDLSADDELVSGPLANLTDGQALTIPTRQP